jgi:hypothetical protein
MTHRTGDVKEATGVVSPHAGYVYSGAVCGETLSAINIPETVVILGPNHHGQGVAVALSRATWQMPMGDVPVNQQFCTSLLQESTMIEADESAHTFEHSLEVQLPFLQLRQPKLTIVPLVISHIPYSDCIKVAAALAATINNYGKPVLMVASSDMSHYVSRKVAGTKDHLALAKLTSLDPAGLYRTVVENKISMCGFIPVTIMLEAAILGGANLAQLIRYTDSGEVSGDMQQVVGYAGVILSSV